MAYTLTWSPTARLDFRDLVGYIAEFDPDAADKFGQGIIKAVERLAHFPESGRIVPPTISAPKESVRVTVG